MEERETGGNQAETTSFFPRTKQAPAPPHPAGASSQAWRTSTGSTPSARAGDPGLRRSEGLPGFAQSRGLIRYASSYNKGQGIGFVMLGTTVDKRVLGKLLLSAFAITPAIQMLVSIGQGNAELLELAQELDEVEHNLTSAAAQGG